MVLKSFFDLATDGFHLRQTSFEQGGRVDHIEATIEIIELRKSFFQSIFNIVPLSELVELDPDHDWTLPEEPCRIGSPVHIEANSRNEILLNATVAGRHATVHLSEDRTVEDGVILSCSAKAIKELPSDLLGKTAYFGKVPIGTVFAFNRAINCIYTTSFQDRCLEAEIILAMEETLVSTPRRVIVWNKTVIGISKQSRAPKTLDEAIQKVEEHLFDPSQSEIEAFPSLSYENMSNLFGEKNLLLNLVTSEVVQMRDHEIYSTDLVELTAFLIENLAPKGRAA